MRTTVRSDQRGVVSILVSMVMILVISLIVLGFAQVTRRNQRENLDNQLSTQAFYAAETGINDARPLVQAISGSLTALNCTGASAIGLSPAQAKLSPDGSVAYTCLNVTNVEPALTNKYIPNGRGWAVPLNTTGALSYLTVSWSTDGPQLDASKCINGGNGGADTLPPSTAWTCSYGMLRLDLMQDTGQNSATAAAANTLTFFLKPSTASDSYTINSFGGATKGILLRTRCDAATKTCTANINLTGNVAAASQTYYARVTALYNDLKNVTLSGPSSVKLTGAQATIDVTGKAQDVLRRIQVVIPLTSQPAQAMAALQSTGSICKLISVIPPLSTDTCPGGVTSGGSPSPPSGGPNGGADFTSCPSAACPSGGGGGSVSIGWGEEFLNTTSNPDATPGNVKSCSWNFGDGAEGDPNPIVSDAACYTGDTIRHSFYPGNTTPPFTCRIYNVILTITYTNGLVKSKAFSTQRPYGTESPCRY